MINLLKDQKRSNTKSTVKLRTILLFYFVLSFIPINLHAEDPEFYTIQIGSFADIESAQKQFDSLVKKLSEREPGSLRIEKIGKFYTVRIGAYKRYTAANTFLRTNESKLQGAIILKVGVYEDRIIQRYTTDSVSRESVPSEKPPSETKQDELKDRQALQQPLSDTGLDASVPAAEAVSEPGMNNVSKDMKVVQKPEPDSEPSTSVPVTVVVSEPGMNNESKDEESQKKLAPTDPANIFSNVKGRLYVSDYYSNDSDDFEFHVLTSRLNVYKHEDKESIYYYTLDARVRKKIFNGEMKENVPEWKVDEAWAGIKFLKRKLDVIGGRQNIYELYNTTIDGLNVKYSFENGLGIGIFGGLAPDKQDESLNADYKSIGGYTFLNKENHKIQFGYENLAYKGDTDREYFSLRVYSKPLEKVTLNAISSASINQMTNNFEVENANATLLYRFSKNLRFNIFYNYFRTIKYYESTREYLELPDIAESFFLDNNSRTRTGMRVDYRIMKGLKIYSSAAYERRKIDGEDKLRLTGGFRTYDLYGFDISGRYTYIDDFAASSDEFNAEISRNFFRKVDLSVYASREEKKLDTENAFTKQKLTYGSSIYWLISKYYFMTAFLERYKDEDYINTSVFTQLGYKI